MNAECPHCHKVIQVIVKKDDGKTDPSRSDATRTGTGMVGTVGALLAAIDDDNLEGGAADFVAKTRERYQQYGEKTILSEKQRKWLGDIADGKSGKGDQW